MDSDSIVGYFEIRPAIVKDSATGGTRADGHGNTIREEHAGRTGQCAGQSPVDTVGAGPGVVGIQGTRAASLVGCFDVAAGWTPGRNALVHVAH